MIFSRKKNHANRTVAPEYNEPSTAAMSPCDLIARRGRGGGRNQELALAAVQEPAGVENALLIALATDGAVVSSETYRRGLSVGLSPEPFLADNNAYAYFNALKDLLKPGATGTNVNDLVFGFGL